MPAPVLPGFLGELAPLLDGYGYLAVGGLVGVEGFGVPAPGETVLVAASIYAGAGHLDLAAIVTIAVAAAITGDNIGFAIGHFGGRPLALRLGRYVGLTPARLDRAESFFARHGGKVVVIARFIEGLRQANGIIAGTSGMGWWRFLAFNALGAGLWVGAWVSFGYLAGDHVVALYDQLHRYSLYFVVAAVLLVGAVVLRHVLRRRAARSR